MRLFERLYERLTRSRWELGIVRNGLDGVFLNEKLVVDYVTNPFRDRWFADPFILDITDKQILILAEEYRFSNPKGRIAKLFINKETLIIERFIIVLELPTHLSFPIITRKNGKVYVYPENAAAGELNLYEYDDIEEKLIFRQTICNDVVWDSVITNFFGEDLLFTANKNDHYLDIYKRSSESAQFVPYKTIYSPNKSCRMAGDFFMYHEMIFCPQQNCERSYGGSVDINLVLYTNDEFSFFPRKKLYSTHKKCKEGLHTFNAYNGIVVIDVRGFDFPLIVKLIKSMAHLFPNCSRAKRNNKRNSTQSH